MSDASKPESGVNRAKVGFGVAWATLIASIGISWLAISVLASLGRQSDGGQFAGVIPPVMMLLLLMFGLISNRRRFTSGVLAAFGTMFALTLLLVGACFGLFALDGF